MKPHDDEKVPYEKKEKSKVASKAALIIRMMADLPWTDCLGAQFGKYNVYLLSY